VYELLDGASLVSVSNYADLIRSDRKYDKYRTLHHVNYPFEQKYEASEKNPDGDLVYAPENVLLYWVTLMKKRYLSLFI